MMLCFPFAAYTLLYLDVAVKIHAYRKSGGKNEWNALDVPQGEGGQAKRGIPKSSERF